MALTKRKMVIDMLERMSWRETTSSSYKYRTFERNDTDSFMFVGRAGGLRFGKSPSKSRSLTHKIPELLKLSYL